MRLKPMLFFIVIIKFIIVYGIFGGTIVRISEAPYQVNYADQCGGVLVHKQWALTTAHCGSTGTYIRVGSTYRLKGRKVQVVYHQIHPLYQRHHEFDYDIQLLKLFQPLHLGRLVNRVRICDGFCGEDVEIYGWGYSKEKGEYNDLLQGMVTTVVPLEDCQRVQKPQYNYSLTSRMFCAERKGVDACQGDSGGAAISSGQLVGLASFGFGCGRGIPGVYTNVSHYDIKQWILNHTRVNK